MINSSVVLIIITLGSAFDCISTYVVARRFEGREQNPFLRKLMKQVGLKALAIWFPLEILITYLILYIGEIISSDIIVFKVIIIFAPWIAGTTNILQFISLIRRHN